MTSLYYIATMASSLADECEAFVMPTSSPTVETSLEILVLIEVFKRLNLSLIKLADTLKNTRIE